MLRLCNDIIFLVLEEFQDDIKSLFSCLLINKTWCEAAVPILWRNPFKQFLITDESLKILFNVILSHLSEKSRNNVKNQGIDLFEFQRPLFNYISFWKHLNLNFLKYMIIKNVTIEMSNRYIVGDEVLKLFINNDTKFVSLSIPRMDFFHILGSENCFSELEQFHCDNNIDSDILEKLATVNTSLEKLTFECDSTINQGIIKFVKVQTNLKEIILTSTKGSEIYCQTLEELLIKCADTVQHLKINWNPVTKFLSYLVNLVSLEIIDCFFKINENHLEKVSLPHLKFLKAHSISSNILTNIIENTKGHLIEITILHQTEDDGKLIQKIYQNCPKLNYLKLSLYNSDISEFQNLLKNCQFLIGLEIVDVSVEWNELFDVLGKFSPPSLFKFKFSAEYFIWEHKLESLKSFLDTWNDRPSMLLQIIITGLRGFTSSRIPWQHHQQGPRQILEALLRRYRTNGIIKRYDIGGTDFDDFEWIQKRTPTYTLIV
ncbi:hypothetical protein RhiirA4_475990 [Rhizophagus irregularis]|uniref:F-box domain-containing protein n=1 Tax=Rhizophagus irregularis TaxID=588596 RepID=A0A2I1HAW2_9GLOM|nr:hypothetical protein RhiirA4_475990 [Rhizophagus irregularis]